MSSVPGISAGNLVLKSKASTRHTEYTMQNIVVFVTIIKIAPVCRFGPNYYNNITEYFKKLYTKMYHAK